MKRKAKRFKTENARFFITATLLLAVTFVIQKHQEPISLNQTNSEIIEPLPVVPVVPDSGSSVEEKPITYATEIPVFMYHHVGYLPAKADKIRKDLTVSPEVFAGHMQYLHEQGYSTVSTEDLLLYHQGKKQLPAKSMMLTFDDGYEDVFQNAIPAMDKYGFKGVFGIITKFVGNPEYANWEQIQDAKNRGMEIVSHSQKHIDFSSRRISSTRKTNELLNSKQDLKNNLGINTEVLVYPSGKYNLSVQNLAKNAGYRLAFTVKPGTFKKQTDLLAVPRVRVHGQRSLQSFINSLQLAYNR